MIPKPIFWLICSLLGWLLVELILFLTVSKKIYSEVSTLGPLFLMGIPAFLIIRNVWGPVTKNLFPFKQLRRFRRNYLHRA